MKRSKKYLAKILSFIIMFSLFANLSMLSEGVAYNTKNFTQFFGELHQMVDDAESRGYGSTDFNNCSNRIVVKTQSNLSLNDKNALYSVEGFNCWHFFQYSNALDTQAAIDHYESLAAVEYVELDEPFQADLDVVMNSPDWMPTFDVEPSLSDWGSVSTNAAKIVKENEGVYSREVIVAILDTGLDYSHPFFDYDRIIDSKVNTVYSGTDSTDDGCGHGTIVAGIIYQNTPSNVKLSIYKVLNDFGYTLSVQLVISAITKAVEDGANVVNMSLGGKGDLETREYL